MSRLAVIRAVLSAAVLVAVPACAGGPPQLCDETLHQDGQHTPLYCAGPPHLPAILIAAGAVCALLLAFSFAARYVRARGPITPARKAIGRGGGTP
jgi:hypothetical protein